MGSDHSLQVKVNNWVLMRIFSLFRSHTLEESVVPGFADNAIATTGKETLTYDLTASDIVQRVDREYSLDWIWQFARPLLEPTDASIVVHGGSKGYACYNKGNELIYLPATLPYGYTDGLIPGSEIQADCMLKIVQPLTREFLSAMLGAFRRLCS